MPIRPLKIGNGEKNSNLAFEMVDNIRIKVLITFLGNISLRSIVNEDIEVNFSTANRKFLFTKKKKSF